MALEDVYNEVKKLVQERYPKGTEYPNGFEHILTDSAGSANSFHGTPPRAVWVLPKPGGIRFNRENVRQIGGKQPQIWAAEAVIEIHLWLPDKGDQEEDRRDGFDQEAGFLQTYIQSINSVVYGKEYTLLDGGYVPGGGASTDRGYGFLLRMLLEFGIYRRMDDTVTLKEAEIYKEIEDLEES